MYDDTGKYTNDCPDLDIVSEWKEHVDEDRIDNAFNEYTVSARQECENDTDVMPVLSPNNVCLKECFKRS